jgi:hypothetical protein
MKLTCIHCNCKKQELEFYRVNEEEPTGLCRECYNDKMRECKGQWIQYRARQARQQAGPSLSGPSQAGGGTGYKITPEGNMAGRGVGSYGMGAAKLTHAFEWPYVNMKQRSVCAVIAAQTAIIRRTFYEDNAKVYKETLHLRGAFYEVACKNGIVFW